MIDPPVVKSFVILGVTRSGRVFRPSDWTERLCGVLAAFRPASSAAGAAQNWSPYAVPGVREGVRCVAIDARLYDLEPLAYRFAAGFAADNDLQVAAPGEDPPTQPRK